MRSVADPDNARAEFAILIRSDWSGRGVGYALMGKIIAYCRGRGTGELFGDVLTSNQRMLQLAAALGFTAQHAESGQTRVVLALNGVTIM